MNFLFGGLNFYLRLGSILFNFILGVLNTVEYRVYHYFLLGSILLGGGGLRPSPFCHYCVSGITK